MSKHVLDAKGLPISLIPQRVTAIKFYDTRCRAAFADQMAYAFLAGIELNTFKAELDHGQWMPFLEKHLAELPHRSANRYMQFATALQENFPTVANSPLVANLADNRLLLTQGAPIPEADLKQLCTAVHDAADGKTLTQFYRDLGVIRQPKEDGGYRPPAKAIREFLKEHPQFLPSATSAASCSYSDLSPEAQRAFRKWYKPQIDPEQLRQARHARFIEFCALASELLDTKTWAEEKPEAIAECSTILRDLLNDMKSPAPARAKGKKKARKK